MSETTEPQRSEAAVREILGRCDEARQDLGTAMRLIMSLDAFPYCKWRVSGSFYHGLYVSITAPDESQQWVPQRDAPMWFCVDDDELPELIVRAVQYCLMQDVKALYPMGVRETK